MRTPVSLAAHVARVVLVALAVATAGSAPAQSQSDYVIFLDDYPKGDFHFAELPDLSATRVKTVTTRKLTLDVPRKQRHRFQVANGDVYSDGIERRIVFGGRIGNNDDWDIYTGTLNLDQARIENVEPIVANAGVREEDPRYSADGTQIVYKCDGRICLYPPYRKNPIVEEPGCELWAPSLDPSASYISYVERCDGPSSDRIVRYSLSNGSSVQVPNEDGGPDRFAHFTGFGEIVYSHASVSDGRSSLWLYTDPGYVALLHDETESDDDPYADWNDFNYIAFSGWQSDGYSLYVYRRNQGDAVRLTQRINVLGPILFR